MELSQLRAFVAVARYGTIAAAADSLHITPSPLSRTIRDLERTVRAELFVRGYHHFELTEPGTRLLPRAVELLSEADDANAIAGEPPLPRIGVATAASDELSEAFVASASHAAGADLSPLRACGEDLLADVRFGELDMIVLTEPHRYPDVRVVPLEDGTDSPPGLGWRPRDVVHAELLRRVLVDLLPPRARSRQPAPV